MFVARRIKVRDIRFRQHFDAEILSRQLIQGCGDYLKAISISIYATKQAALECARSFGIRNPNGCNH